MATTLTTQTQANLDTLAAAVAGLKLPTAPSAPSTKTMGSYPPRPTAPDAPDIEGVWPDAPGAAPAVQSIDADFPIAPSDTLIKPSINIPAAPTRFTGTPPDEPTLNDVAIPDAPDIDTNIPMPTMLDVSIPDAPTIIYPEFTATLTTPTFSIPSGAFTYTEDYYDSALLQAVVAKLKGDIENGTTGLAAHVESAIWARGAEREAEAFRQSKDDTLAEGAARGFSKPTGTVESKLAAIEQSIMNKSLDLSREVMIEQARLAQNNMQFALKTAIELEAQLMNYDGQYWARTLDAAKVTYNAQFEVLKAQISVFNANVSAYQIEATVYEERIKAEVAKLEAFRAEIEAQKLSLIHI